MHTGSYFRVAFLIVAVAVASGCVDNSEPQLKWGSRNWKPKQIGGDLILRELPPAKSAIEDYDKWSNSGPHTNSMAYEFKLDEGRQRNFKTKIVEGDTPWGYTEETWVSFDYANSSNGVYEIFWNRKGRHNFELFKVGKNPKTCWVMPTGQTNDSGAPVLKIIAFEGLEADWVVVAQHKNIDPDQRSNIR